MNKATMNRVRRNEIWEYINTYIQNNHQETKFYSPALSRLKNDLGMDIIDKINLAMTLENEFDIYISEDTIRKWKTVNDIINTVYYGTK